MKTRIDRDFSDEITLKKTMCRLKVWKKIENPPPSLPQLSSPVAASGMHHIFEDTVS